MSVIMPEILGMNHNSYIENYFKNNNQTNVNDVIEMLVFAQHMNGYIIPCYKMVRLVPNLENGIQFIGFLSLAKDCPNLTQTIMFNFKLHTHNFTPAYLAVQKDRKSVV